MPPEYKVVPFADLIAMPSSWQLPASKDRQFSDALQDGLNRMAQDGWALVSPWVGVSSAYLIFSRERPTEGTK